MSFCAWIWNRALRAEELASEKKKKRARASRALAPYESRVCARDRGPRKNQDYTTRRSENIQEKQNFRTQKKTSPGSTVGIGNPCWLIARVSFEVILLIVLSNFRCIFSFCVSYTPIRFVCQALYKSIKLNIRDCNPRENMMN